MAITEEIDDDLLQLWTSTRPAVIQEMLKSHPPGRLYRMRSTGHRVEIYSYSENRTVTVSITGRYNFVVMDRQVFGIPIEDLTECDLPAECEAVGSLNLSPQQVNEMKRHGATQRDS